MTMVLRLHHQLRSTGLNPVCVRWKVNLRIFLCSSETEREREREEKLGSSLWGGVAKPGRLLQDQIRVQSRVDWRFL